MGNNVVQLSCCSLEMCYLQLDIMMVLECIVLNESLMWS